MKFDFEENLKERLEKPEYNTEISLDEILKKVKYPSTPPSLEDLKKFVHAFSKETIPMEAVLTKEQMLEDLEQFKFLIKYIYSGYKVLGEDFFEQGFNKLSKFIENNPTANKEEFSKQINLALEGLNDNHFSIHPVRGVVLRPLAIQGRCKTYLSSQFDITKKENNYYLNGKKILTINNSQDLNSFIKKVCGVNGQLKLGFVVRENEKVAGSQINLDIKLEDKTKITINLPQKQFSQLEHHNNGFIKILQNCIYIRNTACMLHTQNQVDELQDFCKTIEKNIDDADFVIIDSRSNRGGADNFNSSIHKAVLKMEHFKHRVGLIHLCSRHIWNYNSTIKNDEEYAEYIYNSYQKSIKSGKPNIREIKVQDQTNSAHNNKTIFVITDERSASSGEEYNNQLTTFANVVFLNDNSMGMKHFGNLTKYSLNNSKIKLHFANSHFIYGNYMVENKGFPPDVYFDCEADEVLTTLENFINQNTKFKSPSLSHLQKYDKQPFEADITK